MDQVSKVTYIKPRKEKIVADTHYIERDSTLFENIIEEFDWIEYESQFSNLYGLNLRIYAQKQEENSKQEINQAATILLQPINQENSEKQVIRGPALILSKNDGVSVLKKDIRNLAGFIYQVKENVQVEGLATKRLQVFLKNTMKSQKIYEAIKDQTLNNTGKLMSLDQKDVQLLPDLSQQELDRHKEFMTKYF